MQFINGGVTAPKGFKASGIHCGIRKNKTKKDLALILCEKECDAAAVYTQNLVYGAPITVTRNNISNMLLTFYSPTVQCLECYLKHATMSNNFVLKCC